MENAAKIYKDKLRNGEYVTLDQHVNPITISPINCNTLHVLQPNALGYFESKIFNLKIEVSQKPSFFTKLFWLVVFGAKYNEKPTVK